MAFKKADKARKDGSPGGLASKIRRQGSQTVGYNWSLVSATLVVAALDCASANGAAIMVGGLQGNRGISVTVFADGDRVKEFCNTPIEFSLFLCDIIDGLSSPSEDYYILYGIDREAVLNAAQ